MTGGPINRKDEDNLTATTLAERLGMTPQDFNARITLLILEEIEGKGAAGMQAYGFRTYLKDKFDPMGLEIDTEEWKEYILALDRTSFVRVFNNGESGASQIYTLSAKGQRHLELYRDEIADLFRRQSENGDR